MTRPVTAATAGASRLRSGINSKSRFSPISLKVLFVIRSLNQGGAQRQLVSTAGYLKERGHQVAVCIFYAGGHFEKDADRLGLDVIRLKKTRRWQLSRPLRDLIDTIRREKPDVVYSFLPLANIYAALVKLIGKRIRLVWGIRATQADFSNYDFSWRLLAFFEHVLRRIPDQIVVNSFQGRVQLLQKGVRPDRLTVIQNGIDTDRFHPDPSLREGVRRKIRFSNGEMVVAAVARLDPKKDHRTFVRAAKLVRDQMANVRFACIGIDPASVRLPALCRAIAQDGLRDQFVLIGPCQEMPAIYNAIDVLCLSSAFGEGFPNVIGEAMACETPCVATDSGDTSLILGSTGKAVPERDAEALAVGLMQVIATLQDPAEARRLKKAARQRIEERYGLKKMGRLTATRLETLARK